MIPAALAAGVVLGVLSRIEEVTPGLSAGVSSHSAWVAVAFLTGASVRGALRRAALAATAAMSGGNAGYYAWIAVTEPGMPLAAAAGSPLRWVAAGILTGVVFGPAGRLWAGAGPAGRALAALPLAAVLVHEGADALLGGPPTDAIGLVAGLALPAASALSPWAGWRSPARRPRRRPRRRARRGRRGRGARACRAPRS